LSPGSITTPPIEAVAHPASELDPELVDFEPLDPDPVPDGDPASLPAALLEDPVPLLEVPVPLPASDVGDDPEPLEWEDADPEAE
jgi:hypothetical protein